VKDAFSSVAPFFDRYACQSIDLFDAVEGQAVSQCAENGLVIGHRGDILALVQQVGEHRRDLPAFGAVFRRSAQARGCDDYVSGRRCGALIGGDGIEQDTSIP
jgi:hypothetical protein